MSAHNPPPENRKASGLHYKGKGSIQETMRYGYLPFFASITNTLEQIKATSGEDVIPLSQALERVSKDFRACHKTGGKVIFIGNGGSASIASHMAVDYTKNGGIRAVAFNDAPTLTCLANDFGYEEVFAKQLKYYSADEDIVVIISSSGKSPNIVKAARWVVENLSQRLVTLSGADPDNYLRQCGYMNFYSPSMDYGVIEISHLCILHSLVSVEVV